MAEQINTPLETKLEGRRNHSIPHGVSRGKASDGTVHIERLGEGRGGGGGGEESRVEEKVKKRNN